MFVPSDPTTYETPRLLLRPFQETDFDTVHRYASDEENLRFMLFDPNTEEDTRAFLRSAIDGYKQVPVTHYEIAAVLKDTGVLIGSCGITASTTFADGTAEVGWLLRSDYWNKGYGTEMAAFLLRFGFTVLQCRRIIAHCDAENIGSYRVMEHVGMRREGCFIAGRRSNRLLGLAWRDELSYAILAEEWHERELRREIAYYNTLPVVFNGFIDTPLLSDGVVELVCEKKVPGNPAIRHVPSYHFEIRTTGTGERVGDVNLRIGYTEGLYYGGQIGYGVDEPHRGNGYAVRACRLLAPVIRAHGMHEVLITQNHTNDASRRVCEKLGARFLRKATIPEWHDLYKLGQRYENIFAWDLDRYK